MILAFNIGNSHITFGGYTADGKLVFSSRLFADPALSSDELLYKIVNMLALYGVEPHQITGVIFSSVVPTLTGRLREALRKMSEAPVMEVGPGLKSGVRIRMDTPAQLGGELLCAVVGALQHTAPPMVVFNFVTATPLLAADAAHGDGCGWLSSRALAPDGTDQPMNLQRKTMYRDIDGFDAAEVPAVMASFVSLFLRTEAVRQFGLPIAEFFIWSDDWEYTRRISRAKPCYVIPASRVVHAMQNPGVVNIARDVPARWARYRYFYRNDVVLYRREGLSGWLWLLAKDSWHTVQVLRDRQGCRAERIKIIWKGFAAGVRFRPQIPYLP